MVETTPRTYFAYPIKQFIESIVSRVIVIFFIWVESWVKPLISDIVGLIRCNVSTNIRGKFEFFGSLENLAIENSLRVILCSLLL